jgi:glutamate racemase
LSLVTLQPLHQRVKSKYDVPFIGIEPAIKPAATNLKLKDRDFGHPRNINE